MRYKLLSLSQFISLRGVVRWRVDYRKGCAPSRSDRPRSCSTRQVQTGPCWRGTFFEFGWEVEMLCICFACANANTNTADQRHHTEWQKVTQNNPATYRSCILSCSALRSLKWQVVNNTPAPASGSSKPAEFHLECPWVLHPAAAFAHNTDDALANCTRAKSETWLRRNRLTDKRYALRTNFQLKTRGQKRKIITMALKLGGASSNTWSSRFGFLFRNQKHKTHTQTNKRFFFCATCRVLFPFTKKRSTLWKRNSNSTQLRSGWFCQ